MQERTDRGQRESGVSFPSTHETGTETAQCDRSRHKGRAQGRGWKTAHTFVVRGWLCTALDVSFILSLIFGTPCGVLILIDILYFCSTSRQSLETIVEAIRHLEGDHLFNDIPSPPGHHRLQVLEEPIQEVPLALTTKHQTPQRLIKVIRPYLALSNVNMQGEIM